MPHNTPLDWEVVPPMSLRPQTGKYRPLPFPCMSHRLLLSEKEMSDDEDANHDDGVHCK